jgi:adenosylcobyric acid synthase
LKCIRSRIIEEFERGQTGPNESCEYYPCHHHGQDCTYCFCPFYPCNDGDLGRSVGEKRIWDCSYCLLIHRKDACAFISSEVGRLGITDPGDERLDHVLGMTKERFFRPGRSIMVVGATSDAGKSLTVMALCRIISDMGCSVTPLKTQNMSLNSVVTPDGSEIAMIQDLQSRAARITRVSRHVNPILVKPMGDMRSEVFVHGRPFAEYDVPRFYDEFIPGPGKKAAEESIRYLRNSYDHVVLEGAGSPAEINIYDKDLANMRAAEMADADCILVVNTEWGGSFAYAIGTVELLEPEDRERIKAILFNNLSGDVSGFREGMAATERILNIPVLGVIPHLSVSLPSEDSTFFRDSRPIGDGKIRISVVRFPRISHFNDIDPLYLEDTRVVFAERPEDLDGSDAIILPGTKNIAADLGWMRSSGIAEKIRSFAGRIPVLGIDGGYRMMGTVMTVGSGTGSGKPAETEGLGLFGVTSRPDPGRSAKRIKGELIPGGGDIRGYETGGVNVSPDKGPLFRITSWKDERNEGSFSAEQKLFGTCIHGIFDTPAFRRLFLSSADPSYTASDGDFADHVEKNITKLADSFRASIDMDMFRRLFTEERG